MKSAKSSALSASTVKSEQEKSAIGSRAVSPKNVSQSDFFAGIAARDAAASVQEIGLPGRMGADAE